MKVFCNVFVIVFGSIFQLINVWVWFGLLVWIRWEYGESISNAFGPAVGISGLVCFIGGACLMFYFLSVINPDEKPKPGHEKGEQDE